MDDKPNKMGGTPPGKAIADTPATEQISVAETASMYSESTAAANNNMVPVAQQQDEGVALQRTMLTHQVGMFALLSAGSFGAFLILSLPFSALVALLMFVASTMAVFYMLYRIVLLEMTQMMQGRGIGDYLPASMYQQLTTTSVHEWMMDSSFFLENRYLLLYFIPGTTQEQLDSYLERLPARHQYILTRPGLGQFMGSDFMRVIMGQSRYNALLMEDQREEEVIEHGASRQLFENEEAMAGLGGTTERATRELDQPSSAVGLQTPPRDADGESAAAADQPPAEVVHQPMSTDPADVPPEELQQEYNDESDILTDAVAAMTTSYSTMITDAATGYAVQAVDYISPFIIGTGTTVTLGAIGVGIWGWWVGVYHPSSHRTPQFPSSRSLLSTAFMGASSAGMMMLFRSAARSAIKKDRNVSGDEPKKGDGEGFGKKK
jgi:hypothetical protein